MNNQRLWFNCQLFDRSACSIFIHTSPPMKMEQAACSETLEVLLQTQKNPYDYNKPNWNADFVVNVWNP
jgi:hypothetical protein